VDQRLNPQITGIDRGGGGFGELLRQLGPRREHPGGCEIQSRARNETADDAARAGLCREWGVTMTYASCCDISGGRGSRSGWSSRRSGRCRFSAENLEHHSAAGGAFAFNRFAAILHGFFHRIGDFPLGFTLNAISFGHRKMCRQTLHAPSDTPKNRGQIPGVQYGIRTDFRV
jgi:hypothetical protein